MKITPRVGRRYLVNGRVLTVADVFGSARNRTIEFKEPHGIGGLPPRLVSYPEFQESCQAEMPCEPTRSKLYQRALHIRSSALLVMGKSTRPRTIARARGRVEAAEIMLRLLGWKPRQRKEANGNDDKDRMGKPYFQRLDGVHQS